MSEYCLLIVCLVCKFIKISDCSAAKNATDWSAIDSATDGRDFKNGFAGVAPATDVAGDVDGSEGPTIAGAGSLWTKVDVTVRPHRTRSTSKQGGKYRATLRSTPATRSADVEDGTAAIEGNGAASVSSSNRSLETTNTSTEVPRKGVNGETGHAFFYDDDDDDDDYDDDDDDEYDDEDYPKKEEEIEEVEDPDQNVEEQAEAADTEAQEEYNESKCCFR